VPLLLPNDTPNARIFDMERTNPATEAEAARTALEIYLVEHDDALAACSQLNATYTTDYVWQMNIDEAPRRVESAFTQVRLPRTMTVAYPYSSSQQLALLAQSSHVMAAGFDDKLAACAAATIEAWHQTLFINTIVVAPPFRRQGVAKQLLAALQNLAHKAACKKLMLALQTKNYPAIQFVQRHGFVYCGYNDRYYPNGDIALFFSLSQ